MQCSTRSDSNELSNGTKQTALVVYTPQELGQRLTAGLAKWGKPTLLLTGDADKYIKVLRMVFKACA